MKRKTVYRLLRYYITKKYHAVAQRGWVDRYVHGDYSFDVCYMPYGHGWMSAVGGVMCTTGNTLNACKERTTAGLSDMIARGRLTQLLAMPMVLDDVVERGGMVSYQQYTALRTKYEKIAEGMLNA